jgi:flagellar biosynthesis/type III secretory pathway chaperone
MLKMNILKEELLLTDLVGYLTEEKELLNVAKIEKEEIKEVFSQNKKNSLLKQAYRHSKENFSKYNYNVNVLEKAIEDCKNGKTIYREELIVIN